MLKVTVNRFLAFLGCILGVGLILVPGVGMGGWDRITKNWKQEMGLTGVPWSAHSLNCRHKVSACPEMGPQIFMLPATVTSGGPGVIGQQSSG